MANSTDSESKNQPRKVYLITDVVGPDGVARSQWTCVGLAFGNRDGSQTVKLDVLPLGPGPIQVHVSKSQSRQGGES